VSDEFERNEAGLQRTLRERVERFKDPARGVNLDELAELLHLYFPRWFPDTSRVSAWLRRSISGSYNAHGVRLAGMHHSNFWWLSDPTEFARHVCGEVAVAESSIAHGSRWVRGGLPPWFLDDPEAAEGFVMLACENGDD
jgi:hypothetical protein